jgi:two-component system, NarL family, sensor histidine kinase UhpB
LPPVAAANIHTPSQRSFVSSKRAKNNSRSHADLRKPVLLRRGLLVYALLVLILGWSYGIWQVRADRERTLASSSNQLMMTATILAGNLEAMINDGVGAAAAAANEVNARDHAVPLSATDMSAVLGRMLTGGEYVHTLFIVTPSRFFVAQRSGLPLSERPDWTSELLAEKSETWVGKPLNPDQGDLRVLIPIARRVTSIRGEPTWAGALFSVESLDRMYRSLPIERSSVALISRSIVLIRLPPLPGFNYAGVDISQNEAYQKFEQSHHTLATIDAPDLLTGKLRQYAVRQVEPYEIFSVSSRTAEDSLMAWQQRWISTVWTLVIASVALTILAAALYMLLQRRFEAITRSEQRFQLAIAGTNDGIWEWEIGANYVYHSPRYRQLLGVTDSEDLAPALATSWELIHPDDRRSVELALQRHLLHRDLYDVEFRMHTREGVYRWFRGRGQAVWDERGEAVRMAGSISDIHDKKVAEANLEQARLAELCMREELTQNLLLAQEQERLRLANELHDSMGQNLSLIKNHALMLLQQRQLPPAAMRHVAALEELTTEVISEVRAVAQNLRPLHIEDLGLTDALHTLIAKVGHPGHLVIEEHLENVRGVLQGVAATHLYRIAQEALNNVLKHAGAKHCRVTLERDINCVRLIVADDGIGFDPGARKDVHGIGLSSIAERARILHAELRVHSAVGNGTTVHVEVPVAEVEVQATS